MDKVLDSDQVQPWKTVGALDDPKQAFLDKTNLHINLVNKYAHKLGKSYPHHDEDKLTTLLDGYSYMCVRKDEITKEQQEQLNKVTGTHIWRNEHHPEHWNTSFDPDKFDRTKPEPNLDATRMTFDAIDEMMCDWCAVSEVCGNSPLDWMHSNCSTEADGRRWIFTKPQIEYMETVLSTIWQ